MVAEMIEAQLSRVSPKEDGARLAAAPAGHCAL